MNITPHKKGDPGILTLPLVANVPEGHADWRRRKCPICGAECWESSLAKRLLEEEPDLHAACTMCALKSARGGNRRKA